MIRPDAAQLADAAGAERAAYVHVPFCRRVCPYCDFAVVAGVDHLTERYVDAVVAEIEREPTWGPLHAVAFGGGTPSRLSPSQLERIVSVLRDRFGLVDGAEVSLEANPEDWHEGLGDRLAAAGFTRASLGVQSFDEDVLAALGRLHGSGEAIAAFGDAKAAGLSTNLDLIFGTPGETLERWLATVEVAVALNPDHLSVYALTVERGTELSRAVASGAPAPDPDLQAAMYEAVLDRVGLVRYEVSNFARPGHACRYNLITWAQGEYVAFGAAAHRHRDRVRRRNVRRIDRYLERVEAGASPVQGEERLDAWGREVERVFLGLRRAAGVTAGCAGTALLESPAGRRLLDAGVIGRRSGRLVVTNPLLTDEASRAVLALEEVDC